MSALLLKGIMEGDAKDHVAQAKTYRAMLAVDPSNLFALNNLAYALADESPDEALKLALQAAQIAPNNPTVQDTLGTIYYRKGLYGMAVRYLKNAVDTGPSPRRQFHLGKSYLMTGDQTAGQKLVAEALKKDPSLAKTEQGW